MNLKPPKQPASVPADILQLEKMMKAGAFAQAEAPARKAAKKYPRVPIVQMMLGISLAEQEKSEEALKQFHKVARLQPDNADVWRNIGMLEQRARNFESAEKALLKAIAINPKFGQAYTTIGAIYDGLGEQQKALDAYYKAVELLPKTAASHNNLLAQLEITNDSDALEAALENARKQIPGNAIVSYFEGILAQRKGDLPTARKQLEAVRFDLPPFRNRSIEVSRCGHLGRICDKLGDYPAAFKYFQKCKSILAQRAAELGYETEGYFKTISRTLGYVEARQFDAWKPYDLPDDVAPVFLIGFPRSGTTLLDTILRSHPDIEVVEEGPAVRDMMRALGEVNENRNEALINMTAKQAEKLRNVYLTSLRKGITGHGKIIIDKLPLNILHVPVICRIFPNARFILTLRHPADSVLSNYMQAFDQNQAMAVMNKLSTAAQFYDLAMRIWEASLPLIGDNFVESRYEDLVDDMQTTLTPVLKLLGLDWDENMENYRQTALERGRIRTPSYNQVVKPLYKDAQQRWKHYAKPMAGILPLLEPWAERFGYGKLSD
tara:strand:+ start:2790 stop:4436 length:1647 start_codon:yes stop_codon:yes gene_type:complete